MTITHTPKISTIKPSQDAVGRAADVDRHGREPESIRYSRSFRHEFYVEVLRSPDDPDHGVYFSTFQRGRGQHITSLSAVQARELGETLLALADDPEAHQLNGGKYVRTDASRRLVLPRASKP